MKKNYFLKIAFVSLLTFLISPLNAQTVVINEIVTDPQQDWSTNGFDGTIGTSSITITDEWVELYIKTDGLNLTGWTIELIDGTDIVGDLTSSGAFDVSNYISITGGTFTSTKNGDYLVLGNPDGSGAMNNSITINLKNSTGTIIDTVTLGGDPGEAPSGNAVSVGDESVQRIPNGADTDTDDSDFRLGIATLGSSNLDAFSWSGKTNTDWNTSSNWANNVLPTASDDVIIGDVANAPEISTNINATVNNLTISETDGLSLLSGTLTIEGNLTINTGSSLYLESVMTSENTIDAASVILKGTYTSASTNQFFYFTETYHNNDDGWSLISSPTVGELVDGNEGDGNFAVFNVLQQSATNYGIAIYDNSQSDSNLRWNYYSKAEVDVTSASASITMDSGIGYSIFPNSGASLDQNNGNIGFKGSFPTSDFTGGTAISITDNSGTGGNAFNFIGNPYPAFIPADNTADATNAFLNVNSSELAEATLWIWDKNPALTKGGEYIPINQTSNRFIAPAQGFFVKSKAGGGSISFTKAMQNHQTSGTFNKTQSLRPEINLIVTQNKDSKKTQILYLENKTTGFDNGYDSSIFGGETNSFSIFTKLVSDNNDSRKLGIQSLPNSGYENMVIPVGLISEANSEITFSAEVINLPNDLKVQLEDRATGRFTNLNETDYTVVLNEKQDGSGRFFIHTSQKTLSVNSDILSTASIYKVNNQTLKINGLKTGNASIAIYNILGKQVLNKNLQTTNSFEVVLPNMASGVYVVKLNTKEGQLSTKIMID